MKRIIVSVTCAGEPDQSCPNMYSLDISDELKARIKDLSKAVEAAKAYRIEEFNYQGTWSKIDTDYDELTSKEINSVIQTLGKNTKRVDCNLLEVTANHFRWSSVPKYYDDDMALTTNRIPISFLDNQENTFFNVD